MLEVKQIYAESLTDKWIRLLKARFFRAMTKSAAKYFMRAGDSISLDPYISGWHERRICELIFSQARDGLGDFFIDIGANIGLNTCLVGSHFKQVHCYEPNPNCFKILEVNTSLSLDDDKVFLNNFGLADKDKTAELLVPKQNWGGGFVLQSGNSYSLSQLTSKDGLKSISDQSHQKIEVTLRSSNDIFTELFHDLELKELRRGIIKIDVEGNEPEIIKSIIETVPPSFALGIYYESWDHSRRLDFLDTTNKFRVEMGKLVRQPAKHSNKLKRVIEILRHAGYRYELRPYCDSDISSDIFVKISEK